MCLECILSITIHKWWCKVIFYYSLIEFYSSFFSRDWILICLIILDLLDDIWSLNHISSFILWYKSGFILFSIYLIIFINVYCFGDVGYSSRLYLVVSVVCYNKFYLVVSMLDIVVGYILWFQWCVTISFILRSQWCIKRIFVLVSRLWVRFWKDVVEVYIYSFLVMLDLILFCFSGVVIFIQEVWCEEHPLSTKLQEVWQVAYCPIILKFSY